MERFLRFHRDEAGLWGHRSEMGNSEINAFLTHLAVDGHVAASTQNQAFSALHFLFREVRKKTEFEVNAVRARRPRRLPFVLSVGVVRRLLEKETSAGHEVFARCLYSAG